MTHPLLTIMIPTTIDRDELYEKLVAELNRQINRLGIELNKQIEIISLRDNKEISVGLKRQRLLEMAKGKFVVGFDSDDFPHQDYIEDIWCAIIENPNIDHIGFLEDCTIDGEKSLSIFSIRHKQWGENIDGYDHVRCANPKSVIKREKALQVGFPDLRFGEDRIFSEAVTQLLGTEVFINKPLYQYIHISSPSHERYGYDKEN